MKKANLKQTWKSLVLLTMLLLTGSAAWAQTPYKLWIANTQVTSTNRSDLSVIDGVTGTVMYNPSTGTLTLTDASIDYTYVTGGKDAAIRVGNLKLTIEVNGDCTVRCSGKYGLAFSDMSLPVTLTGCGKLTIIGTSAIQMQNETTQLIVDGPTVVARGQSDYGICGTDFGGEEYHGILTVNSGVVKANGNACSSIGNLNQLNLGEGMEIAKPVGAKFYNHAVTNVDGTPITSTVTIQAIPDMNEVPLTLEAIEAGTVTITNELRKSIGYAKNGGDITWVSDATITIDLTAGQQLTLYGDNDHYCSYMGSGFKGTNIQCSADCYIYGNIMSLISSSAFKDLKELGGSYTFVNLFKDNTHIKNHTAKQLLLPATTLKYNCYKSMFYGCTGLTSAPELPATTLASGCYMNMFYECSNLLTAPELPALTLKDNCYDSMFFTCTKLQKAPELRASVLVYGCYSRMFMNCHQLNYLKCLATDISATGCTSNWVFSVNDNGTFLKAAGFNDWTTGINGIPSGWTVEEDNTYKPCELAFSTDAITVTYGDDIEEVTPVLSNPNSLPVTYTSSAPSVATVDASTGKLTILTEGTTTITATFAGDAEYYPGSASYTLTVNSKGEAPELSFDREAIAFSKSLVKAKAVTTPVLTISDGLTATYSSSNNSVASVNATTGALTINGIGTATITATTPATLQYAAGSAKYFVIVLNNAEKFRCDANGDGNVSITDAVTVVNFILHASE